MSSLGVKYSLRISNKSLNDGVACVYQTPPDTSDPKASSLAWFVKFLNRTTTSLCQWQEDYSFVWADTGVLVPGVVFIDSQNWPADLTNQNQVTLTYNQQNVAYTFKDQGSAPKSGDLHIRMDETIPSQGASVGIGMSGSGIYVVQAQPNWNLIFTPKPRYWITFGRQYELGQVLSLTEVSNPKEIIFPRGTLSMTATIDQDNVWKVEPTKQTNERLAAERLALAGSR